MNAPQDPGLGFAGRFELLSRIGVGGMGEVYLAVLRGPTVLLALRPRRWCRGSCSTVVTDC